MDQKRKRLRTAGFAKQTRREIRRSLGSRRMRRAGVKSTIIPGKKNSGDGPSPHFSNPSPRRNGTISPRVLVKRLLRANAKQSQ